MNAQLATTVALAAAVAAQFIKIGSNGEQLPADATEWDAVLDPARGLMFTAKDVTADEVPHAEAEKACAALSCAGFTDWRLPTVEELFLLADRTRRAPAIDTAFFPTCKSDFYWASSPWAGSPDDGAWGVGFGNGGAVYGYRDFYGFVRAVRSVAAAGQ